MSSSRSEPEGAGPDGHRSIFLSAGWQHVRYLGWHERRTESGLPVWERRHGPISRRVVLHEGANGFDPAALAEALGGDASPLRETLVHDFAGSDAVSDFLRQRGYRPLGADARLLNMATFVVDLAPPEGALLAALSADARRKLRRAREAGLAFDGGPVRPADLAAFFAAHDALAEERNFKPAGRRLVQRMLDDGAARLFTVRRGDTPVAFLLAYMTQDRAIFLHGAATAREDGVGYLLQWGTIAALKSLGLRWYDMGGLPALDSANGIYRFKKAFGGRLVRLGVEYGRTGLAVRVARRLATGKRQHG